MSHGLSLSSLLEESRRLNTHLASSEIPTVHRSIDLLESESRKLVARSIRSNGSKTLDPRAQSLLAGSGVDTDKLTENKASAALLSAFETLRPTYEANVESFLAQQQEQCIVNAIEETELFTLDDFDQNMASHMQQVWEDTQTRLFEELGQYQAASQVESASRKSFLDTLTSPSSTGFNGVSSFDLVDTRAGGVKVTNPRVERYAQVVRRMNDARVANSKFDLLAGLEKATADSSQELKSKQLGQVWKLLGHFGKLASSENGTAIATAACDYLEESYMEHIDRAVAQYPHDANVGGVPSIHRKIQGFLKVQFGRLGRVPAFLEVFDNEAIWAHMFTLYRCGYKQDLLKYALEMEDIITDSDPGFVSHLKAFLDNSSSIRSEIPVTASSLEDPYKAALFKAIGRGNVPKKATAEVTQTTEDYLWAQLTLVRDSEGIVAAGHQRHTLEALQDLMLKFGPGHFDPNGTNSLLYFRVLLLCGLFENAVDYLLQVDRYQIEAVHMAIILASYGLLRIPMSSGTVSAYSSFLATEANGKDSQAPMLDFTKIVANYARAFPEDSNPDNAVHYLLLLTLPSLTTAPDSQGQLLLCEQALVRVLYEKRDYAHFLGDIQSDGTRARGMLEKYLPLLGIKTSEQYSQAIIRRLADRSSEEGRLADTVLLYNLGERYNTVLNVLCKQLGEAMYIRCNGNSNSATTSNLMASDNSGELGDVEGVARAVLVHYKQRDHIARVLDTRAVSTCQTLLSVIDFYSSYQRGAYEEALQLIESTQLLPLNGDVASATQHAEQVRSLDDAITRNFSSILLYAMDTLSRLYVGLKESPFLDSIKQANMMALRKKARGLMVFAGMVQFRMPSDTYAKLNRMDVFMN